MNQHEAASISLEQRLLDRRIISESGCWVWRGAKTEHGYGRMSWQNRVYRVHRLAAHLWLDINLDDPREVCHHCDIPPCFNPECLFVGSHAENVADMMSKGRWNGGKAHDLCNVGHPLIGDNIKADPRGRRQCRECHRRAQREYYRKRKQRESAFWRVTRSIILDDHTEGA